jgi:phosphoribosylformylglycinamidine cyclo-ligase
VLPEGTAVEIDKDAWPVPALFRVMQELGNVSEAEMHRTFNMGIGMVIICTPADADTVRYHFDSPGQCYRIGRVVEGGREVKLI